MRIFIATGIFPPEIGGPAQYALNLRDIWEKNGHQVSVKVFSKWNQFPTGLRHFLYFLSILHDVVRADFVLILDTYSCALPTTMACRLFRKKMILRTGGDFVWEAYIERTGDLVTLPQFYKTRVPKLSFKERFIFSLTKSILNSVDAVIWSTEWQKNIFTEPYELQKQKHFVVENYYGPRFPSQSYTKKNFVAFSRKLKLKHIDFLKKIFNRSDVIHSGAVLDTGTVEKGHFLENLKNSYAVIVASLSDISPNVILDAIRCQKPFILTKENGLYDRVGEIGLFVDPMDEEDVARKVIWLSNEVNYQNQKKKIELFSLVHTWEDIASEYINVYNQIK